MRHQSVRVLFFIALLAYPGVSLAKVSGPCVNCHTMHNSQGGTPMAYTLSSSGSKVFGGRVNAGLLNTDCIGCHQGANVGGSLPFVLDIGAPNYGTTGTEAGTTTLAGGNFHWVSLGAYRTGHNVSGITAVDATLVITPPGGAVMAGQLTCAGTLGCHGSSSAATPTQAIMGGHHGKDRTIGWQDGTSVAKSYRFLNGIQGLEDSLYELQPTASRHNKYFGVNRITGGEPTTGSISSHCARCHGDFHNGSKIAGSFGVGVWLRHPVDFDMSRAVSSAEYVTYNGGSGTGNPYSVVAPVATTSTSNVVNDKVYSSSGDAIVMCLSCHRAHGTPYDAIMRWDYKKWPQGGYNGCAVCHTTKD